MNSGKNGHSVQEQGGRDNNRREYDSGERLPNQHSYDARPMSGLGFTINGEVDPKLNAYGRGYEIGTARHQMGSASRQAGGYGEGESYLPFSRSIAMEWTGDMENSDGTRGPHWNMEQVQQVMEQRGIDCDPVEFFAVLNSIYSDYCAVAKKHGVNKMDFYADLAKAWLEDKDAVEDKAGKYFTYIVRH